MEKLTNKDKLSMIATVIQESDISDEEKELLGNFVQKQIEILNRKRTNAKPTKEQELTGKVKQKLCEILATCTTPMRASDLLKNQELNAICEESGVSLQIQRVTAALSQLCEEKKAKRETIKKVAYFSAETAEEVEGE